MATFDLKGWLRVLDAETLSDKFESKGYVTVTGLAALTETDLDQLGFPVGSYHSNLFLRAAEKLRSQTEADATQTLAQDLLVSVLI